MSYATYTVFLKPSKTTVIVNVYNTYDRERHPR